MSAYLEGYGAGEEQRIRIIKVAIISLVLLFVLGIVLYYTFRNFREEGLVKRFLSEVNARQYQAAYHTWGCDEQHPCRDYSYSRFMEDWGKPDAQWKVDDTETCGTGVFLRVAGAHGATSEPLWVDRGGHTIGFSPFPECTARKWRWGQFFDRLRGKEEPPPAVPAPPKG